MPNPTTYNIIGNTRSCHLILLTGHFAEAGTKYILCDLIFFIFVLNKKGLCTIAKSYTGTYPL